MSYTFVRHSGIADLDLKPAPAPAVLRMKHDINFKRGVFKCRNCKQTAAGTAEFQDLLCAERRSGNNGKS